MQPVRWDQHLHGLTNRLIRRVSENPLGAGVPALDNAVEILLMIASLQNCTIDARALFDFFGAFAIRDVN